MVCFEYIINYSIDVNSFSKYVKMKHRKRRERLLMITLQQLYIPSKIVGINNMHFFKCFLGWNWSTRQTWVDWHSRKTGLLFKVQVHIMILIVFFFLFSCREPIMPFVNNVTACDWFSYVEKIPRKFGICSDCQPSQIFFSAKWKLEIREIHDS